MDDITKLLKLASEVTDACATLAILGWDREAPETQEALQKMQKAAEEIVSITGRMLKQRKDRRHN